MVRPAQGRRHQQAGRSAAELVGGHGPSSSVTTTHSARPSRTYVPALLLGDVCVLDVLSRRAVLQRPLLDGVPQRAGGAGGLRLRRVHPDAAQPVLRNVVDPCAHEDLSRRRGAGEAAQAGRRLFTETR